MAETVIGKTCVDEDKSASTCIVCYGRDRIDGSRVSLWTAIERHLDNGAEINVHEEQRRCWKLLVPCLLNGIKRLYRKEMVIGKLRVAASDLEELVGKDNEWKPPRSLLTYVLMMLKLRLDVEKHANRAEELAKENEALRSQLKAHTDYTRYQVGVSKDGVSECKHVDEKVVTELLMDYGNVQATLRLLKASLIDEPGDLMSDSLMGLERICQRDLRKFKDMKATLGVIDVPIQVAEQFKKMIQCQRDECDATIDVLKKKRARYDLV